MHAQNSRLGSINDRGTHHRAENAAVSDGERTTSHLFNGQLVVASSTCKAHNLFLNTIKRELFRVADNRYYQAFGSRYGNADVAEIVEDDVTGYLVYAKRSDMIAKRVNMLLEDDEKRKKMGENAYKRVLEKFNWDKIAGKFYNLYERTMTQE